ncbi:MAG: hypothetical protein AABY18_08665 [Candidatus Thermoplasmatota archaeon]
MADEAGGRRPTKLVLAGVGLFVLAVVLGRLLMTGGAAWVLLGLALPVVLIALGAAFGLRAALVLTVGFTVAVLVTRWFVRDNPGGWVALLLLPVVALTALIVGRVLGQLRRGPAAVEEASDAEETPPSM